MVSFIDRYAIFTLFQIITTEGWVTIMIAAVDSTEQYKDPIPNNGEYWLLYFILYELVGFFFLANLFIGVIIDNFNQMKKLAERSDNPEVVLLSEAQQNSD